jgi:hypothetical protein
VSKAWTAPLWITQTRSESLATSSGPEYKNAPRSRRRTRFPFERVDSCGSSPKRMAHPAATLHDRRQLKPTPLCRIVRERATTGRKARATNQTTAAIQNAILSPSSVAEDAQNDGDVAQNGLIPGGGESLATCTCAVAVQPRR